MSRSSHKKQRKQKLDVVLEQYKQKTTLLSNLQTEQSNMAQAVGAIPASAFKFLERTRGFRKSDGNGLNAMSDTRSTRQRKRQRPLRTPRKRTGMSKIALAAIASALAMTNAGCGSAPPASETLRSTPVTIADVQEYSGGEGVNYSASIVPYTQLPLSFKSGGYVTSILQRPGPDGKPRNLQQGDYVKKDAVVATVRQADYQHSVEQYKGQLEQAQAGQLKAQQDFARAEALYKANALTQTDYDSAKAQLDSTQGAVATAQAAVAQAQQALSRLRTPRSDGRPNSRAQCRGRHARRRRNNQAFTMGDMEFVKAVFGIPDTLLSSVQLKQRQGIRTETYAQEFFGQVSAISPQADHKSRTFQVEVTIPNPKGLLKSGMVATLDIGSAKLRTPALVVPDRSRRLSRRRLENRSAFSSSRIKATKTPSIAALFSPVRLFGNMVSIIARREPRRKNRVQRSDAGERRPGRPRDSVISDKPNSNANATSRAPWPNDDRCHIATDSDYIQNERNTARFFVENRQISWILLIATVALGIYGYAKMPKRKDPSIPVRVASVQTQWPGADAEQVEQLVTRPIESTIAQNPNIRAPNGGDFGIKSLSIPGLSIVQVQLSDTVKDSKKEFSDMNLKLNSLSLPQGAGPIKFNSDFGDTAALMLTVASPLEDASTIAVRVARDLRSSDRRAQTPQNKIPRR